MKYNGWAVHISRANERCIHLEWQRKEDGRHPQKLRRGIEAVRIVVYLILKRLTAQGSLSRGVKANGLEGFTTPPRGGFAVPRQFAECDNRGTVLADPAQITSDARLKNMTQEEYGDMEENKTVKAIGAYCTIVNVRKPTGHRYSIGGRFQSDRKDAAYSRPKEGSSAEREFWEKMPLS